MSSQTKYDAIVVGSGPNGFAAAITMQKKGLSVLLIEGKKELGGGVHSAELTLPGFIHDVCSAVYPLGENSPVFKSFRLGQFGLKWLVSENAIAHPFDNGDAVAVKLSVEETAAQLGKDRDNYQKIFSPLVKNWDSILSAYLGPIHLSAYSNAKAKFAYYALSSAAHFAKNQFKTEEARALFAGMGAHTILPLNTATTTAMGLVLNLMAHVNAWPVPEGGARKITDTLAEYFKSLGGEIETGNWISSLKKLPSSKVVLLDVTPQQLLSIAGDELSSFYKWQLKNYKYGEGVFKVDWALSQPVPFSNVECRKATTVHLGGSFSEIYESEDLAGKNKIPERPFVLFVQPGVVDPSRAPGGKQTAWAYCHVPSGSTVNMTAAIENQVERFAPGFKDCILERHIMNSHDIQAYNPNYIGGDINGGAAIPSQLLTRPVIKLSPYRTSAKNVYLCSSSTPPGGGVHGICGYYAARRALKDNFEIDLPWL
ncbi:MAG: phytoene desaturase family protein [Ginsengibacter sp.]